MFEHDEIEKVVDLQEKSYKVFLWITNKLKTTKSKKHSLFDEVHERVNFYNGCLAWITKHRSELPNDARPDAEDLESFAHLMTSFLQTSFEVSDKVKVQSCPCPFCCFFTEVTGFKRRKPDQKARSRAHKEKLRYIKTLCREESMEAPPDIEAWLSENRELAYDISYATYGRSLIRRSKFSGKGEEALVLWREIAWDEFHPKDKFKLLAREMIISENRIIKKLKAS